ncbi:MAG TPA: hypothetical protein VL400_11690, partial [Polyangiaceae bacterium]|nr:hypothetical protein [Polyangiaceae bacterium]
PLPLRARVLARLVGRSPEGAALVRAAAAGDARGLAARLAGVELASAPPPLVHALACYLDRLADAYASAASRARTDGGAGEAVEHETAEHAARLRAIAAWARLFEERRYLAGLAHRVAAELGEAEIASAVEGAAMRVLDELASRAARGAADTTRDASLALAVLARVPEACRSGGASAAVARRFGARAEGARADAVEVALAGVVDALREARQSRDVVRAAVPALEAARAAWEWAGRDEAVERLAVDELTTIAWDLYRVPDWAGLRALLAPIGPLAESLEARVLRDPVGQLAYAAKCAQVLVFMSEAETDWTREWNLAERALAVCPTHRNGRLVMANLCVSRAIRILDGGSAFSLARDIAAAEPLVVRAEKLFPQAKKLPDATKRLEQAKRRAGIGVSP